MPDYDGEKSKYLQVSYQLNCFIYIGKCTDFITSFQDTSILDRADEDPIHGKLKYMT